MPIPSKQPYKSQSFIERTDINEFLRDDRVIGEIYNATIMSLSTLGATLQPLDLLNDAYYLCTLAIKICALDAAEAIESLELNQREEIATAILSSFGKPN